MFDWVQVGKKRMDYSEGTGVSGQTSLLTEALDKLYERDGKDALDDFDGVFFLYAGYRRADQPRRPLLAAQGVVRAQGQAPELFHLPRDERRADGQHQHAVPRVRPHARPARPVRPAGEPRLGGHRRQWGTMSEQLPTAGRSSFSAWSKEQLGWLKPAVIDPTVKQKLILAPVEDSAKECFKVLLRPDGSEYFLLENRRKKGFDTRPAGRGAADLACGRRPPLHRGVARHRRAGRAGRVPRHGALPDAGQRRLHAVYDAQQQVGTRRRPAGQHHQHPQAAGRADHVLYRV